MSQVRWLIFTLVLSLLGTKSFAQQNPDAGTSPSDAGTPRDGADAGPAAPSPATESTKDASKSPPKRPAAKTSDSWTAPRVDVIGHAPRALDQMPGTGAVINREDIRQKSAQNAGDVLRAVTGINVRAEDPMGLRLNIGIRGLDPDRSRKVLILEDGMPLSLNPYGAPELYYTPPVERMERIEIVKGSGQILWGPQTIGGVINYITRDPPRKLTTTADLRYGSYGYLLTQASVGNTNGAVGWRFDVLHRRFDGPRRLNLDLTDVTGKLRIQLTPTSIVGVKLNFYDEQSSATYLGLTTPQYAADPTLSLGDHDRFNVRRYSLGLVHQQILPKHVLLQTSIYAYQTAREWRRQEFERQDTGADYERICDPLGHCGPRGASGVTPTNDGGSIFFRQSAAIRNRQYWVTGVEPRANWGWNASKNVSGELTALARFHYERAKEQILIGTTPYVYSGDINDEEIRNGYALALAVQNRFSFWQRLHVTPGLRFENFWSDRHVVRAPAINTATGRPFGTDVDTFGRSFSYAIIPGLGVAYDVAEPLTLFTGVHRGYSPPRTRDGISPAGQNLRLDPELSWNIELGARFHLANWLSAEIAGFHMEFENQITPPSETSESIAYNFNTGHSRHTGLEAMVTFDFISLLGERARDFSLPLSINYTYLPLAAYVGGLYDGNRLPYAPEQLLYVQLRFTHRIGFSTQISLNYVSSQFADKENTTFGSLNGLVGELPGFTTLDARVAYAWRRTGLTFSISGKNLTNQIYIANRAPSGIQPAGFLQIFGGIEWTWQKQ